MQEINNFFDEAVKKEIHLPANVILTEEQLDIISERAKDKALNDLYAQVGRGIITKLLYVIGSSLTGLAIYITSKFHRGD